MEKTTLQEIWNDLAAQGYKTDKGDIHAYLPIYEEILKPYRETTGNILEIGLFNGNSFRMWNEYFSINTRIYGIDCDIQPHGGMADLRALINEGIGRIFIMDAENQDQVAKEFAGLKFDVIVEDAGHHIEQQLAIYKVFKKHIAKGGIYIIEDIQDIDRDLSVFQNIDHEKQIEIIDVRHKTNRYDDCLVIIRDKQ